MSQVKTRYRDQRGLPVVDALLQDARFGWRVLSRDRGFTVTAVLVLALGIGVNNMMFTILNAHTIRGLPIPDAGRVIYVSTRDAAGTDRGLSWPEFADLRDAAVSTALGAFVSGSASLANEHEAPDRVERSYVAAGTLTLLSIQPFLGRSFTDDDAAPGGSPVAILSEGIWKAKFKANPAVLDRTVLVDGLPTTVVGVIERASGFPAVADIWQPLERMPALQKTTRTARVLRVVGRVRAGADVSLARAEIETQFQSDAPADADGGTGVRAHVTSINERFLGRLFDPAWLAFIAVGCLVALISCANVANLLLGRALHREREIALRTSLGATRLRIVRQLLIESTLLASVAGLLGLAVSVGGVQLFRSGIPANVLPYWMDYVIDGRVLAALFAVSTIAILVFGLIPALQASRSDPQAVLRQGGPTVARTRSATRWTGAFLVVELALGVVMLANLALGWRVSGSGLPTDPALDTPDVLTATLTLPAERYPDAPARRTFLRQLRESLDGAPGIRSAAATSVLPVRPAPERQLRAWDTPVSEPIAVRQMSIGPGYFDTLGLGVEPGRDLPAEPGPASTPVLINAHLAAILFPGGDPLGQCVGYVSEAASEPAEWLTIVGVAPVIRQRAASEPEAIVYQPLASSPPATISWMVRSELSPEASAAVLRDAVWRLDPNLPLYSLATLGQATSDAEWNGRVSGRLLLALTSIAIGLAAVGLFAVTSRAVGSRRREIGIRMAIGAVPSQIRGMVLRQAFRHVGIGVLVGVAFVVAWDAVFMPSARARAVVPGASLTDPYVLLIIAGVLAAITVLSCLVPLGRALRIEPSTALRVE